MVEIRNEWKSKQTCYSPKKVISKMNKKFLLNSECKFSSLETLEFVQTNIEDVGIILNAFGKSLSNLQVFRIVDHADAIPQD